MSASDGARIGRHMLNVSRELTGEAQKKRLLDAGKQVAEELEAAVRTTPAKSGTLADLSLSAHGHPSTKTGWHKVDIKGTSVIEGNGFAVKPINAKAYGPLRVLNDGRQAYQAGDKRVAGQRFSKKAGMLVDKNRRVKRNTGATPAKHTWFRAKRAMELKAPRIYAAAVSRSIVKAMRG